MSTISEIIDRKGGLVLAVKQNDSVFDAIRLMAEVNVGAVLVTEEKSIIGIFTERDYLQKIALNSRSSRNTEVKEVMSSPVITATPHDSVRQCMETMTSCRCRHLPVVDGEELLGIVSIGDLVKKLLEEKESEIEQLSHYIAGSY
ncbi:MAG: CBS domain-containing protein [Xanthomonadales bacterium]|nr:CBS domain-containing protein [Gammaproteobacteria bacterium]NNE04274.1 CBS domain-containing protein [Xanthomonadales bacterium]NNL95616.1 CBS domain-containing protein [Xanthomonadales bacterium]